MKKTPAIIIVILAIAAIAWYALKAEAPATKQLPADTDSASSINTSVDALTVDDSSEDFQAMDSDIESL